MFVMFQKADVFNSLLNDFVKWILPDSVYNGLDV